VSFTIQKEPFQKMTSGPSPWPGLGSGISDRDGLQVVRSSLSRTVPRIFPCSFLNHIRQRPSGSLWTQASMLPGTTLRSNVQSRRFGLV
jgi:hypothetical protein